MTTIRIETIELADLRTALDHGTDHGGNPIESFVDDEGGWPLRCCLTDSQPGDEIAIVGWSPFPWNGPFAERGPIVVHTGACTGWSGRELPAEFDKRPMTLRPYLTNHEIAYDHVRHVAADDSLLPHLDELLSVDEIDFVHGRNPCGGCYAFTAVRDELTPQSSPST